MLKIYSKLNKKKLLHIIYNKSSFKNQRTNLSDEKEFLQAAFLTLKKNHKFVPHKHIWKKPRYKKTIAQESWVVLRGKILFTAYDINGKLLSQHILSKGYITFTYEGGHTYESLVSNTQILEYKTGPYEGIRRDKVLI